MFLPVNAPVFAPSERGPVRRRPPRYPLVRRDPRRFARGIARIDSPQAETSTASSDWRFFTHSFAATFLFVSLLIA
jgi:hypothetical protein